MNTINYEKEINDLKNNLEKAKNLKYRAEARLEQLNKQEEGIISELNELGIKPENLEDELNKLSSEIKTLFKEANELLPKNLLGEN